MYSSKEAHLSDVIDILKEKLDMGGTVAFTPRGDSMLPMLRNGKDIVVLAKPNGRLKLFDVPLYRRADGSFVLHRVIDFGNDGSYVMCGDNQFKKERGIKDSDIIAVLVAFNRKGRPVTTESIVYRAYVSFWYYSRIFRRIFRAAKRSALRLFGKSPKVKADAIENEYYQEPEEEQN